MSPLRQLALPFPHEPDFRPTDFLEAPSNGAALAWLGRTETWPRGQLVLWGEAGRGKTHLLHRWARRVGARQCMGASVGVTPEPLDHPLGHPLGPAALAVDDADLVAEEPLLHLLNAATEAGLPTLLTARSPPSRWAIRLPDLASRVRAITAIEIGPPEDSLLRALLARLLAERQVAAAPSVQDWLLIRLPRTTAAVREAAARLDRASLAAGTAVTRATAGWVLRSLGTEGADSDGEFPVADEFSEAPARDGSSLPPRLL